jgi:hypothetical protein
VPQKAKRPRDPKGPKRPKVTYYEICKFSVNYKTVMFYATGACAIKNYNL